MKKNAQGLSMNTIIVAALALLVLIIIAMIFTGRIKLWRESTDSCASNGGVCVSDEIDRTTGNYRECSGTYEKAISGDCPEEMICCLKT
ncbi:hypothetical protein JXB41_01480 [Candidatus Woesearchaeota archaeon]|nr:hypothetical protein [Candidatus Woesearchaeota archaeon]